MHVEGAHQRAVVCSNLEVLDTYEVVVALMDGVHYGEALKFNRAVSGLHV